MAKTRTNDMMPDSMKMNRIRPRTNTWFNVLFIILAAAAIIPVVFVFMISISSEESIRLVGYSFVPQSFSGSAY